MTTSRFNIRVVSGLVLLASWATAGQAHHGFAFEFDVERQGTIAGVVTRVQYTNPHVVYMVDVEAEDGATEEWLIRTHNVGTMNRLGWDRGTIEVGDRIEVSGSLGRGGTHKISLDSVVLADGSVRVPRGGEYSDAYTTTEVNASADKHYGVSVNDYALDITGGWSNGYKFQLTVDDLEPKPTPFTPEARAIYEATENWQDPARACKDPGLPRWFGRPTPLAIVDAGSHYVMTNGGWVRRVWMNGREPPADFVPSPNGFSAGRWEDNVLLIETTHLTPVWLDGSGLPMSGDDTRIVERWVVSEDGLTMDREMTIHDPRYYTAPLVRRRGSAREDGLELAEGGAVCDPTSYLQDLYQQGRIETIWED